MDANSIAMWLIIIWIVLVILLFVFLFKKYTFGDWTKEKPNPYKNETLAIPRGAMRSVLTLSILFLVLLLQVNSLFFDPKDLFIAGKIFIPEERFGQLMTAFEMVIAFYFGGKVMHHITKAEQRTADKKTEAVIEELKRDKGRGFDEESALG